MSLFGGNGNLQNNGGCLNMLGGGLLGGGCAKSGCGLLLLLPLLYFLWSLFFGANKTSQNQVNPTVIHDTVYVEVIKDRVDTLTVIRMDTVSYIDSNNKTTYEMVSLPNVQFYTNSDVLLPTSAKDLQQLAEYLTKNDSLNATIFGHTDNTGDPKYNLYLSQKRAESVMKFLTSLGIDSERLKAKGMGDLAPKGDNTTKEGRLMNRRVEVTLTETEKTEKKRTQIPNKKK
jgi:outer membrane protein OmpA-like peptidoglycan-associated protein